MKIPFRPSLLKLRRTKTKFIIIHHTAEMYDNPNARVDNLSFQSGDLLNGVSELKQPDVNYHIIIERIKEDYHALLMRPFISKCDWPDIPKDINNSALHVALIGDYNFKVPSKRLYDTLGYRILSPFVRVYALSPIRIKTHREVSIDPDNCSCPGEFFSIEIVQAMTKKYFMR